MTQEPHPYAREVAEYIGSKTSDPVIKILAPWPEDARGYVKFVCQHENSFTLYQLHGSCFTPEGFKAPAE